MNDTVNRFADVVTVDGYNRSGKLDTIRIAKPARSRLVAIRRAQEGMAMAIRDTFNNPIPIGMTAVEFRAFQQRIVARQVLPPVEMCDYDIGPGTGLGPDFAGEIAWLVGGNDENQLPEVPESGFFDFGIDVPFPVDPLADPDSAALASAGIDFITAGEIRVRINGAVPEEEAQYVPSMTGRAFISNGFLETEDVPVELSIIPAAVPGVGVPTALGALTVAYLERPSNVYNLLLTPGEITSLLFIGPTFPIDALADALIEFGGADIDDPFTIDALNALILAAQSDPTGPAGVAFAEILGAVAFSGVPTSNVIVFLNTVIPFLALGIVPGDVGVAIILLSNIFLGDAPLIPPTSVATFDPAAANVQPLPTGAGTQLYTELGIDSFEYLLKVINESGVDLALFVGLPDDITVGGIPPADLVADNSDIYSNANVGGAGFFLIPADGAGFFNMRVDDGIAHIMLSNVQYDNYTEPDTL